MNHKSNNTPSRTDSEGYSCHLCDSKFRTQFNLKKQTDNVHNRNENQKQDLDCVKCGRIFDKKRDVNEHVKDCEVEFTENRRECRYFRRGNCRKGDNCKFKHNKQQNCRNGQSCCFFQKGRCRFSHSSQTSTPQYIVRQGGEFRYCTFGAQCRNLPQCPLLHYNMDFPYLPSSRNPPSMLKRNA